MSNLPLFAGILASMIHVITGPDHLAAVSPLAIESKRKAWKVGFMWGLGHLTGMLSIGILVYLFRELIPFENISAYSEKSVGAVLLGLGIWTFVKIFKAHQSHKHPHTHNEQTTPYIHIHSHDHNHTQNHSHPHTNIKKTNLTTALFVGFIHGLAGIAHFLLLLPVLGFENNWQSAQYIIGFGIGSIIAMSLYALVLGHISERLETGHQTFSTGIRLVAGMVAIILGIYWMFFLK